MKEFLQTNPELLVILTIAALLGGMMGFVFFTMIYRKNRSKYITLGDAELASEILNLRTRIQTIYIVGPLAALILAFLGLQSLNEIRTINNDYITKQVSREVNSWIETSGFKKNFQNLLRSEASLERLVSGDGLVFRKDISDFLSKNEIDSRIQSSIDNRDYSAIIANYLTSNYYMDENAIKGLLINMAVSRDDFLRFQEAYQSRISGLSSEFLSKRYQEDVEHYSKSKSDYVTFPQLERYVLTENLEGEVSKLEVYRVLQKASDIATIKSIVGKYQNENLSKDLLEEIKTGAFKEYVAKLTSEIINKKDTVNQ